MHFLNFILEVTTDTLKFYRAVAELNCLSDKELNDLGLTRGEIAAAVYLARFADK